MAAPDKSSRSSAAGLDLNAQIQARVAARRQGGERTGGHLSVAQLRAAQLNGNQPAPAPVTLSPRRRHAPAPRPPGYLHRLLRFVVLLVLTAVSVIGLRTFVIASYYIPSASMETTLHGCPHCEPDMVLVDKLSYRFKAVARTDVVVFDRPPLAPPEDKELIKRVIGLPGEVISGHSGHVYIDNRQLIEPYVNRSCDGTADFAPIKVPAGQYFMMGDNRCDSFDSRMFGSIPRADIVGRAFAVIWPVKHLRWL